MINTTVIWTSIVAMLNHDTIKYLVQCLEDYFNVKKIFANMQPSFFFGTTNPFD